MRFFTPQKLAILLFLFVLCAPVMAMLAGMGEANWKMEKREPAPLPLFTWQAVYNGSWFANLGDFLRDRTPYRQQAGTWYSGFNYHLFGDSANPEVWVGHDGWLFIDESLGERCQSEEGIGQMLDDLRRIGNDMQTRYGTAVSWLIVPNKAATYPEKLTPLMTRHATCATHNRQALRRQLANKPENTRHFFALWQVFEAARNAGTHTQPLYLTHDTHWTHTGALVGAEHFLSWLEPGIWQHGRFVPKFSKPRSGDLAYMLGLSSLTEPQQYYRSITPKLHVNQAAQPFCTQSASLNVNTPYTTTPEDKNIRLLEGRTVIVRDSFLNTMRPYLLPYFSQLDIIHFNELSKVELEPILACADRVIFETAERHALPRMRYIIRTLKHNTPR